MPKTKLLIAVLITLLVVSVGCNIYQWSTSNVAQDDLVSVHQQMTQQLTMVQTNIDLKFASLDAAMLTACQQLSATGLTGAEARAVLTSLVANDSLIVNAATCDTKDVLLAVEPQSYSSIEGEDISMQEQNIAMHQTMRPAMSNMIPLVEGFPGVVMVAPIFDGNDRFIGSLSIVIQPYLLISNAIVSPAEGTAAFSMWAMQTNGTLIYDPDPSQQSKNLFTDPLYTSYPEVQEFAHSVAEQHSGYGGYQYYDKDVSDAAKQLVEKEAYWVSVGVYGTEWRLVVWRAL
jgi:hypothetical protein